jgi:hypothetical protein
VNGGEDDAVKIAKDAVLRWLYLARTKQRADILYRLANRLEAQNAWRKLAKKKRKQGEFWEVASFIGRDAIDAHLSSAQTKTGQEIKEAATEAVSFGKKLIKLIERNATLRNPGFELMPPVEAAALDRILGGLIDLAVRNRKERENPEDFFPSEIERELDELVAKNHPEFKSMTTSLAYRVLNATRFDDDFFLERLRRFVERAEQSATIPPILPKPKEPSASHHHFALSACSTMMHFYGAPNCEAVADLASVVFDTPVKPESVKAWWKRRKDYETGDNSEEEIA